MAFPNYNFAQELATPNELGIGRGGGFDQIGNAIAGTNYYFDAIGFGDATGFARMWGNRQFREKQKPLGVQFFTNTGRTCSNGEPMYEYISTIPDGNLLGERVKREAQKMGLPPLKGLGTGIVEDARDALDTNRLFSAFSEESSNECKKMRARVGDARGRLASEKNPADVWITDATQPDKQGFPTQEYWVSAKEGFETESQRTAQTQRWIAAGLLGIVGVAVFFSYKAK